jgi:hypothetical protein
MMPAALLLVFLALQGPQTLSYFVGDGTGVEGYAAQDRELAVLAFEAWARESGGRLRLLPAGNESEAALRLRWVAAAKDRAGELPRMPVPGKPGAIIFVSPGLGAPGVTLSARIERDRLFRDTIVYLSCLHQIGHALGLSDTTNPEDAMFSFHYGGDLENYFLRFRNRLQSRTDIRRLSGLSANDIAALRALR